MNRIQIKGHIGPSYVDQAGELHKGVELVDLMIAVKALGESPVIAFEVESPGGYVQKGDQIYDWLLSLKKGGKTIEMYQIGLIGSIATKIFMAGDVRELDPMYEFFIHNPWANPEEGGDADWFRGQADSLDATEKDLRKFYSSHTKITDEGLDALMKDETSLTAEQAVSLGFATRVKSHAFALIKHKTMAKKEDEKSFLEHVKAFFNADAKPKGIVPVAAKKPENKIKALVVELADGAGKIWLETEDLTVIDAVPAFLVDETDAPTAEAVPNNDYKLSDGRVITVVDGKATLKVEEEAAVYAKKDEELDTKIAAAVKAALEGKEKEMDEKVKAEILALKKHMKIGTVPVKPFFAAKVEQKTEKKLKPIEAAMALHRNNKNVK